MRAENKRHCDNLDTSIHFAYDPFEFLCLRFAQRARSRIAGAGQTLRQLRQNGELVTRVTAETVASL